jgi:hypothetical protein
MTSGEPLHGQADLAATVEDFCAHQGDAEIARLLALMVLPRFAGHAAARALLESAIARLVRADADPLPVTAVEALTSAVQAVCARTRALPRPLQS